jgi:hypothetical protein
VTTGEAPSITLVQTNTGGASYYAWGLGFDASGNLYLANTSGGQSAGGLVEYLAPITATSMPAVSIATSQFDTPYFLAITKTKRLEISP